MKSFGLNNYSLGLTNNLHKLALSLFSWKEKGHLEFPTNMDHCLREEHTDFLQSKNKTKKSNKESLLLQTRVKVDNPNETFFTSSFKSVKTLKTETKAEANATCDFE